MKRKDKLKILQRIRRKAGERKARRRKKLNKKRIQCCEPIKGLPVPRKFRRKSGYTVMNKSNNRNNNNKTNKKKFYINNYLPTNLNYLLNTKGSPFYLEKIKKENYITGGVVKIPKIFSILESPVESYLVIKKTISALLLEDNEFLVLDYQNCKKVELGSQVLLDIILKDFISFSRRCRKMSRNNLEYFPKSIAGKKIDNEDVRAMMFSVGSPVTLKIRERNLKRIIPYKLCIHNNEKEKNYDKKIEQKEIDTTEMADYVINCLERMNKNLTPAKRDDLCTVIGEILINAEEHSTTQYRFSIGYFEEKTIKNKHYGIFRLTILNFGKTIYEKFKDENCSNKNIVKKMTKLSKSYSRNKLFSSNKFEEENLWTLYALQEGVSSMSPEGSKRGNGSIQFIDSFFNLKGSQKVDNISFLTIQSGKTRIHFNGEYEIVSKTNAENEIFKVMTFNESGNIEEKPDSKYVYQTNDYFPGTIISAKLLFDDENAKQIEN